MHAQVGDRVRVHGRIVGSAEHDGVVIEVRGTDADPLLVVRYDDGHEALLAPGSDCEIQHVA